MTTTNDGPTGGGDGSKSRNDGSMSDAIRRTVVVIVLVGAVVAAGVVDQVVARTARPGESVVTTAAAVSATALGAAVAPVGVESSAGYCAVGTAAGGAAAMTVLLSNTTAASVTGTITAVSSDGSSASVPVTAPASTQVAVVPPPTTGGDFVAASVVLNGGGVGIWEQVAGPLGYSTTPCAAAPATQWYFAHGTTAGGNVVALMLFNPGAAPAVVDVALATSIQGFIQPSAYQGVEVPAGALVVENVGDHAINDPSVSMVVTALSGSVVAGQLEQLGTPGQGGLAAMLGAPSAERTWSFPYNVVQAGETVLFNVFNPATSAVTVTMEISLQTGSAEPLKFKVPAQSTFAVVAENQTRIPVGAVYGAQFVTTKESAIVVDREMAITATGAPGAQEGETAGVAVGGPRWLVPVQPPASSGYSVLALENASTKHVVVSITALVHGRRTPIAHDAHLVLGRGAVVVVNPAVLAVLGADEIEVDANGLLSVEADPLPAEITGVTTVAVLPLH